MVSQNGSMNGSATDSKEVASRADGLFLYVDSDGNIMGKREIRQDLAECQTWFSEYLGSHFRVQRLHPSSGPAVNLRVRPEIRQRIETARNLYFSDIVHHAQHETGHAATCYALRLDRINFMNLTFRVTTYGNLFLQIAVGELIALAYIKGTTSVGDANSASMDPLHTLGWACYALGGIAGCGDDRGAKEDLDKFDYLTADLKLDGTAVGRLQTELQNLANDIIRDPIVSPRHGELARSLSESRYVDRDGVEKILLPASLPDYSPRLAEIGKKFNIGGAAGQRRSFPLSELPL